MAMQDCNRYTESQFIDYKLAIGMLVVAGYRASFTSPTIFVEGEAVACCYRDGTTYKVKQVYILDFIEDNQALRSM